MTLSGPEALRSLEEALRDVRREEDEVAKRLARSSELAAKLRETEGELFRQLAAIRLDPATQTELSGRLSLAEKKAREMIAAHARSLKEIEGRLAAIDRTIDELTSARAAAVKSIEEKERALEALERKIQPQLAADPAFAEKSRAAEELVHIAEESLRKTTQAETDHEAKGEPYRNDPLFMYLWNRGFGTGSYKAGNLTRWLDGLVARHIGFHRARPNFVMLNEIPQRLREHAERQGTIAATAQEEISGLIDDAVDAAGGKPLREALTAARTEVARLDERLLETEDGRDDAAAEQQALAQGSDPKFASAVGDLAEALGREDLKVLLDEARATRTGQDDTIVGQIDAARQRSNEERSETREHQDRLKVLAARRRELEDIQFEFKKSRFDDPRSTFGEDKLIGDTLTDFLRGGITAASYWDMWRRSQNWRGGSPWTEMPRTNRGGNTQSGFQWPDSSFGGSGKSGGFNFPSGGGVNFPTSSRGGFSRPRGGSKGTRRHGGFKTGGGF